MISLTGSIQSSQIHRGRRWNGGYHGLEKKRMRSDYLMDTDSVFQDEKSSRTVCTKVNALNTCVLYT